MKLDDARVVVVSGAGEDEINGVFVSGSHPRSFPPNISPWLLRRAESVPARTALLPQP